MAASIVARENRSARLLAVIGAIWLVLTSVTSAAGILNVGLQLEPPNLDPTSGAAAAIDEVVYANVFEGLTRINEDGTVSPLLAERWTISEDGTRYHFYLRSGVRFHDGTPLTAHDVKFSLDRAGAPNSANAQRVIFELIDDIQVISDDELVIALKGPLGAFLVYLGWGDAVILSEESSGQAAIAPVGTGPFQFESWRKGSSVTLVKNNDYWGTLPALDGIRFNFIPDPTAAYAALLAGDVDGFPNYPAPENLSLLRKDERFQVLTGTSEGEIILAINNAKPPFDDLRVRRALSHAIDKQAIVDGALFGNGTPIGSHFPPHHPAYTDLSGLYPYNPGEARRLLDAAGVPDGFAISLALPPPAYARRSGEIIAAQLSAVGIDVSIRTIEWAQWLDRVFANKDFDLTVVSHTEPLDIDIYSRPDYYFQYDDENVRAGVAQLQSETNIAKRHSILKELQSQIADDAVNVFLASGPKIGVWRNGVSGVWRDAPLQANDFTNADFAGRENGERNADGKSFPVATILIGTIFAALALAIWRANVGLTFLATRLMSALITLLIASFVVFFMMEIAPGDPAAFMMGVNADAASVASLQKELGLDQPVPVRYFNWVTGMITGDFGTSYTYRTPVAALIAERLTLSFPLALLAFGLSTLIGIPAGVYAAARQGKRADYVVRTLAQGGIAIPNFWLAILMVSVFAIGLGWFTAGGFPGWENGFWPAAKALLLPAIALAIPQAAILTQIMRSSMNDVLEKDFIRTAQAKGLSRDHAIIQHGFRNALIPVLTILGLQFSFLIAGAVIIENVFYLPGLGRLIVQAIAQRDLVVIKGVIIVLVFIVILSSLIVDLTYAIIDPRLRKGTSR